jgi:hypothetical protein
VPFREILNGFLEVGKQKSLAENIEQISFVVFNAPGRANAEICKLGVFDGRVPTLKNCSEIGRLLVWSKER